LSPATIAAQFIRSVPPTMIARLLGYDLPKVTSALLFPYASARGGFMDAVRLKLFPPQVDAAGHAFKYAQPKGSAPRVYFIRHCLREVLDGDAPLWVVEGEKKSLAVAQLGLPAIGIAGVEGWHIRGSRALLPDFDAIRLGGRIVEVLPDADYETNPNVRRAVERLGTALAACGAHPRLVMLPSELPR
jgi:hypothetical protein